MGTRNLDERLEQLFTEGVEFEPEVKKEIWNNIEHELFEDGKKGNITEMKRKRSLIRLAASVAAVAIIVIGLNTQPGLALVNRIREMFEPEKNITQDIEGSKEEQNVQLNEGGNAEYVIYVDQERYKMVKGSDADRIVPNSPLPDRYPEVSMEIRQVADKDPDRLVREIEALLKEKYEDVTVPEQVEDPVKGWMVRGLSGSSWDSTVERVYVISNRKEGSFIITQRYFLEAAEGHGARFYHMLKEFYIVED